MKDYFTFPQTSLGGNFLIAIIIIVIAVLFIFILRSSLIARKKEKTSLLKLYSKKFALNEFQTGLLLNIFETYPSMDVESLFNNEFYYHEITNKYTHRIKRSDNKADSSKMLDNDFKQISAKMNFTYKIPMLTSDIPDAQSIKLKLENIGFISGTKINNDKKGILINTYFKSAVKKLKKDDKISLYYWDDLNQFEAHSRIKKIAEIHSVKYLLIKNSIVTVKNKESQGIQVNKEFPVYFTHLFKLPEKLDLKTHTFQGNINSLSVIGMEIFTRFKVIPEGIFLFEFQTTDKIIMHFTGKVTNFRELNKGKLLFITYIDMKDECRDYIHDLIFSQFKNKT